MGAPVLFLRPCSLALDKWKLLYIHAVQTPLSLAWSNCDTVVGITPEYRAEIVHLIKTKWHKEQELFDVQKLEKLVGKSCWTGVADSLPFNASDVYVGGFCFAQK